MTNVKWYVKWYKVRRSLALAAAGAATGCIRDVAACALK
jgi:hypothetical protein